MATPRTVVIDDTDSRVSYIGEGWFQGNGNQLSFGTNGLPYNRTSHGTSINGNLLFSFEGTSVGLYGTSIPGKNLYECSIDNQPAGKISASADDPQNNEWLCGSTVPLRDGPHTFFFQAKPPGNGAIIWVDRLEFTASPEASFDEAVLVVDKTDPRMSFGSGWPGSADAQITSTQGSQARFDFVGKGVTWIGFIPADMPHSPALASFSIDGGPFQLFTLNGLPANWTGNVYYQEFFTTPELVPGPHSLVVKYNGNDTGPATPLTLQQLYVTTTSTDNLRNPPVPASSATPNSQSHIRFLPALIGGIGGGLVLVALAVSFCLWRRRRLRRISERSPGQTGSASGGGMSRTGVTPFRFLQPFQSPSTKLGPPTQSFNPLQPPIEKSSIRHDVDITRARADPNISETNLSIEPNADLVRRGRPLFPTSETAITEGPPKYTAG